MFEDEQINNQLLIKTKAPIFQNPSLRRRLEKVMEGTEKSKIYDTVRDRQISLGIEPAEEE